MIEIGIPFSDPLADGPIIQQSSETALKNGMTLSLLFSQLKTLRNKVSVPVLLMGYINPILQYGFERFLVDTAAAGIDGTIVPDLPFDVYEKTYRASCENQNLHFVHLITQSTSDARLQAIDKISTGFIYAVSSHAITGGTVTIDAARETYFKRLQERKLKHPIMIGFGISNKLAFSKTCEYAHGAIVGSAFVKAIGSSADVHGTAASFIKSLR